MLTTKTVAHLDENISGRIATCGEHGRGAHIMVMPLKSPKIRIHNKESKMLALFAVMTSKSPSGGAAGGGHLLRLARPMSCMLT